MLILNNYSAIIFQKNHSPEYRRISVKSAWYYCMILQVGNLSMRKFHVACVLPHVRRAISCYAPHSVFPAPVYSAPCMFDFFQSWGVALWRTVPAQSNYDMHVLLCEEMLCNPFDFPAHRTRSWVNTVYIASLQPMGYVYSFTGICL